MVLLLRTFRPLWKTCWRRNREKCLCRKTKPGRRTPAFPAWPVEYRRACSRGQPGEPGVCNSTNKLYESHITEGTLFSEAIREVRGNRFVCTCDFPAEFFTTTGLSTCGLCAPTVETCCTWSALVWTKAGNQSVSFVDAPTQLMCKIHLLLGNAANCGESKSNSSSVCLSQREPAGWRYSGRHSVRWRNKGNSIHHLYDVINHVIHWLHRLRVWGSDFLKMWTRVWSYRIWKQKWRLELFSPTGCIYGSTEDSIQHSRNITVNILLYSITQRYEYKELSVSRLIICNMWLFGPPAPAAKGSMQD